MTGEELFAQFLMEFGSNRVLTMNYEDETRYYKFYDSQFEHNRKLREEFNRAYEKYFEAIDGSASHPTSRHCKP